MMRKLLVVLAVLLLWGCGSSFDLSRVNREVQTSKIKVALKNGEHEAVEAIYHYPKKYLEAVVGQRFKKENLPKAKSTSHKFKVLKGAHWKSISPSRMDYYYKVDGDKKHASLVMLASKGYDNFVDSTDKPTVVSGLKRFMKSLEGDVYRYAVDEALTAKKAKLEKEQKTLKKKKKDYEKAKSAVEERQKAIEAMKAKFGEGQG